jgi:hypothetical protein
MNAHPTPPSSADLASEAGGLSTGLGIITVALFPVAVPGLLFVVVPLALMAVVGLLLAIPFVVPVWLVRTVRRRQSRGRGSMPSRDRTHLDQVLQPRRHAVSVRRGSNDPHDQPAGVVAVGRHELDARDLAAPAPQHGQHSGQGIGSVG